MTTLEETMNMQIKNKKPKKKTHTNANRGKKRKRRRRWGVKTKHMKTTSTGIEAKIETF